MIVALRALDDKALPQLCRLSMALNTIGRTSRVGARCWETQSE